MKKLMTIMLGLSFLTGVVVLADDTKTDKTDKKKSGKGKKKDAKKTDDKKS